MKMQPCTYLLGITVHILPRLEGDIWWNKLLYCLPEASMAKSVHKNWKLCLQDLPIFIFYDDGDDDCGQIQFIILSTIELLVSTSHFCIIVKKCAHTFFDNMRHVVNDELQLGT